MKYGKGWCFSNGENGEKLVFQAMEKIGKSLCFSNGEIGVSATEKEMLLLKKNRKMLLKGSMMGWIMN